MTVVLGRCSIPEDEPGVTPDRLGIRRDLTWEQRRRQYRLAHTPTTYPTWQPDSQPLAMEPAPDISQEEPPEPVRPGLMWLYAARIAHARCDLSSVRRASAGERLLVGEITGEDGPVRSMVVMGAAAQIGRGEETHYQRLHPVLQMRYGRLRCGGGMMGPRERRSGEGKRSSEAARESGAPLARRRQVVGFERGFPSYARISTSKRLMLATICAILLIVSAASTSLAGQQRYEVREGDTIESVADMFGVDPDAIRTSSYLPDGDYLSAGQVIVIPEPGQSPVDAAQMAAANEGASPWVATAYWVEWADNPASIAAQFGVGVDELLAFNGIEDPLNIQEGDRILIPATATSVETNSAPSSNGLWVPDYKQQRNLSCEYAAVHAAAMAFGWAPTEQDFIDAVPEALNPHYGYRGNIDGWWGNTQDYGIYAEPLVPVLNDWGFNGEVIYTFGDTGPLIEHLDAGHPVVTWLGFWGDTRERLSDDSNYSVFAGMHVVTVYDYDDYGVWVMDPAKGEKVQYSWDFFIKMWSVVDGMSLAVYPY